MCFLKGHLALYRETDKTRFYYLNKKGEKLYIYKLEHDFLR